MIINDYISIDSKNGKMLYISRFNSAVYVNENLFNVINYLKNKYKQNSIEEDDSVYLSLKKDESFEILKRNNLFSNSENDFEKKYNSYRHKLTQVYFHITMECNLRCKYCYLGDIKKKNTNMTFENFKKYFNAIFKPTINSIVLTGGEPFLNPELGKIAHYLKLEYPNIILSAVTNGTLLKEKISVIDNLDYIIVSLDLLESKNRIGLNHNQILEDLESMPDYIKKKITVRSIVSAGEEDYVQVMKEKINNIGMRYKIEPRLPNSYDEITLIPNIKTLSNIIEIEKNYNAAKCGAGTGILSINYNGDVYPCQCLMKPEFKMYNIKDPDKLFNEKNIDRLINANILKIDNCKDCEVKFLCGGGCRALSYNVYRKLNHRLEFFCNQFIENSYEQLHILGDKNGI